MARSKSAIQAKYDASQGGSGGGVRLRSLADPENEPWQVWAIDSSETALLKCRKIRICYPVYYYNPATGEKKKIDWSSEGLISAMQWGLRKIRQIYRGDWVITLIAPDTKANEEVAPGTLFAPKLQMQGIPPETTAPPAPEMP